MKKIVNLIAIVSLLLPCMATAGKPAGSVYIDGSDNKSALILAHGKGKHPTWLVVDPLRKGVSEQLGYHTLSLQMPVGHETWTDYADDFPDAFKTIQEAIRFLKEERDVSRVFLMGHSMGSRMMSAFLSENPATDVAGVILAGCRNNGGKPLGCEDNIKNVTIPVLDIWGGDNGKDYDSASERSYLVSKTYTQVEIPGANHKFRGYEKEFVSATVKWLEAQP